MKNYKFTITEKEILEAVDLHRKSYSWTRFRPYYGTLALIASFWFITGPDQFVLAGFFGVFGSIYVLFSNKLFERRMSKHLRKTIIGDYELEIDEKMLKLKGAKILSEFEISVVKSAVEGKGVALLYLSRMSFLTIPKSIFADDREVREFMSYFPDTKPGKL